MNPREFYQFAAKLAGERGAAQLRSASSRAYYAVYNVGVTFLNEVVPISKGAAAHGQVQKLLANSGEANVVGVGSDLGDLHSRRIDADYEMADVRCEHPQTVTATVAEAGRMIELLDQAFTGARSTGIKRTIQQYWTQTLREPLRGRKPLP